MDLGTVVQLIEAREDDARQLGRRRKDPTGHLNTR